MKPPTSQGEGRIHKTTLPPQEPITPFPGCRPQACSPLNTKGHVVSFLSGSFTVPPSFLCPVRMQESQAPRTVHSHVSLTNTAPPLTTLLISFIYGFIILTLHLSLCFLLTQPFFNVISIPRIIAPPKDL